MKILNLRKFDNLKKSESYEMFMRKIHLCVIYTDMTINASR